MREVYGKLIYDSLEALVMPSHTSLVVVDMQNDLVSHGGLADRNGTVLDGNRRIIDTVEIVAGRCTWRRRSDYLCALYNPARFSYGKPGLDLRRDEAVQRDRSFTSTGGDFQSRGAL